MTDDACWQLFQQDLNLQAKNVSFYIKYYFATIISSATTPLAPLLSQV